MPSKNARLLTVRFMSHDLEAIEKVAKQTGKSRNKVAVEAIRKGLEECQKISQQGAAND